MDSTTAEQVNYNINMDSAAAEQENYNINMDSATAEQVNYSRASELQHKHGQYNSRASE
jgi:hypothetical protein